MGIRFLCPNGHKLNVKTFLAGKRGVCPQCGAKFDIPALAETQNSEPTQLVAGSQSFVVDTISPSYASSAVASPSVIIEVADTEPSPGKMPDSLAANAIAPARMTERLGPIAKPPESVVATDPDEQHAKRRARRRRNQFVISICLLTVVVVLAVVLIWVLKRG